MIWIISIIWTVFLIASLNYIANKLMGNQSPDKIKGEKLTIEATIEQSWGSTQSESVRMLVKYVIEDKEFENSVSVRINPIGFDVFKKGKPITIVVDKKDYNNIAVDTEWLYNSGAMRQLEYKIRKHKNEL